MSDPDREPYDGPAFARLDAAFDRALGPWRTSGQEIGLLFSGGVDSALLAWELRGVDGLELVTVGTRGSPDLAAAESAARRIGIRWSGSVVSVADVRATVPRIASETEGAGPVQASILTALALALERAHATEVVCGQGADELFLGYAHYGGLGPAEAARRSEEDRRQLLEGDWPRTQRIATRLGRRIAAPYLDPDFVRAALDAPIERRLSRSEPKAYFRSWARHRGLPPELSARPKRAMQYGSGVDRVLRARE